jgi:2-oxoglutarate dehydrogenase E1 component
MLLPHGYEGQGPEHSSARLERYLQLCAEHNMQVCIPTTPAQVYHMLRRQAIRPMRRPLIVLSPKWILRHKLATSSLEDLANGEFQNLIQDAEIDKSKARRLVLCSGIVYYHLYEARLEKGIEDIALVRIEQLYPFPDKELLEALGEYSNLDYVIWCKE